MTDEKKKMTAQGSSVGADDGQSISKNSEDHYTRLPDEKEAEIPRKEIWRNCTEECSRMSRPGLSAYCDPGRADG